MHLILSTAPYTYLWNNNQQIQTVLFNASTAQQLVLVTDALGCTDTTLFVPNSLSNIASNQQVIPETCSGDQNGLITIYPNPFSNDLTISGAQINLVEVFDARGVKVTSYAQLLGEQITKLNLGFLPSGVYELRCLQYEAQLQFMILKM